MRSRSYSSMARTSFTLVRGVLPRCRPVSACLIVQSDTPASLASLTLVRPVQRRADLSQLCHCVGMWLAMSSGSGARKSVIVGSPFYLYPGSKIPRGKQAGPELEKKNT